MKNAVREELIRRELLLQEAKKAGIDKKTDVAAQAEAMRQSVIIRAYVQSYTQKNPISDAQLKSQYDAIKAQLGSTEYKAGHILVKEEADAKAIIENLKKGAKFDDTRAKYLTFLTQMLTEAGTPNAAARAKAVLVGEDVGRGVAEVADDALHLGAVDQLLALQNATEQ